MQEVRENEELVFNGYKVSVWDDGKGPDLFRWVIYKAQGQDNYMYVFMIMFNEYYIYVIWGFLLYNILGTKYLDYFSVHIS